MLFVLEALSPQTRFFLVLVWLSLSLARVTIDLMRATLRPMAENIFKNIPLLRLHSSFCPSISNMPLLSKYPLLRSDIIERVRFCHDFINCDYVFYDD